jgi:diguanylate cyclase (GGDEF)-like protein/PAS domain S-box-containing protein
MVLSSTEMAAPMKSHLWIELESLLEAAPDAAMVSDDRGKIVMVNEKTEALFRCRRDGLLGQAIETWVPAFRSARAGRVGSGAELHGLREDGTEFPLEISLGRIEAEGGPLVWATIVDVTERKARETSLHRSLLEKEELLTAIRQHEALLRHIIDNIPAIIICKDAENDFRFSLVNKGAAQTGVDVGDVGKNVYDLVPKEQADAVMEVDRRVIAGRETVRIPRQLLDTRAGRSVLRMTKVPIALDGRKPRYVLVLTEDITEQDRFEQLRRMQLAVTRELADATTFDGAVPTLLRSIAEGMDRELACLWWIDDGPRTLRLTKTWSSTDKSASFAEDSLSFTFERGVGLPGRVWDTGLPQTVADVTSDVNFPRIEHAKRRSIHGAFGFPILGQAGVLGVMEILCHRTEGASDALASVLADIGGQMGQFYDRRIAEEERDCFFSMSPDMLCISGADGFIKRLNPAFAVLGYTPEELMSRPIFDFMHPDDVERARRVVASGTAVSHFENRYRCKDGSYRWLLWSATPDGTGKRYAAARDITERKHAEAALRQSEERFRMMIAGVTDYAIFMLDPDGNIATWNEGAQRLKGYRAEEVIGRHFSTFYPEEDIRAGKPDRELQLARDEGRVEDVVGCRIRKDGSRFWANVVITAMRDESGRLYGFSKITRDITERRIAERKLQDAAQEFRLVIEKLPVCIMIRRGDTVVYVNPATAAATGYADARALVGKTFFELVHPDYHDLLRQRIFGTQPENARELRVFRADGTTMLVEAAPAHIPITFEGAPAFLTSIRDITQETHTRQLLKDQATRMQALSDTDELTHLHNRRGFLTAGGQQLRMAVRTRKPAVVVFMDLDGLKIINDELGHEAGDDAIVETARLLRSAFREVDILARLGGDEFVAMLVDCENADMPLRRLGKNIEDCNARACKPFRIALSIGTSSFDPKRPEALDVLMQRADTAMYDQKRSRRSAP